jgi:hypothetical protein
MPLHTRNLIRSVEKSVTRLLNACHKDGHLYSRNPRAVAQINRTGKWLLNALRQLVEKGNRVATCPDGCCHTRFETNSATAKKKESLS